MEASMNLGKMSMGRDNGCAVPAAIQGLDGLSRRRDWTKTLEGFATGPQGQASGRTANGGPAALLLGGWPCAETAKQGGSAVATLGAHVRGHGKRFSVLVVRCALPRGAETWEFTSPYQYAFDGFLDVILDKLIYFYG